MDASTRRRWASASATWRTSTAHCGSCAGFCAPAAASPSWRSPARAGLLLPSTSSGSTASYRCSGSCCRAGLRTRTSPRACAAFRDRRSSRRGLSRRGSARCACGSLPAGSSLCTRPTRGERTGGDPRGARTRCLPGRARAAPRAGRREVSRHCLGGRRGGARRRREAAAAAAGVPVHPACRGAAGGRRRRRRARPPGDADARRPDRRCAASPRARLGLVGARPRRGARGVAILANATLCLARGEAMQRRQRFDPDTTIEAYLERCTLKTGKLFEAACRLAGGSGATIETGKIAGTDLREGTPTLPLLIASQRDDAVRAALAGGSQLEGALLRVASTGAIEESREVALAYARSARACLNGELHREELESLTYAVVERAH